MITDPYTLNEAIKLACPGRPFRLDPVTYEGLTMLDDGLKPSIEEIETAWANRPIPPTLWDNAQDFMAAFTMQEKSVIALSADATIAALRFELSTWLSTVHSADARVQAGLNRLVELGILTAERKEEIISTAH